MEVSKELEGVIAQMLKPLKGISLSVVIEGLSGNKIIPFDKNNEKDIIILEKLKKVAIIAGKEINKNGISVSRPNEVGNAIESYIRNELNNIGYNASIPKTKKGKHKSTGYPDIEFIDEFQRTNYLECKTYNDETDPKKKSMRTFYLSPSDDFKITKDAHHFIISYEISKEINDGNNLFRCKSWKILSIENLEVDVKYEFNCDNSRMYKDDIILADGKF